MIPLAAFALAGCLSVGASGDRVLASDLAAGFPEWGAVPPETPLGLAPAPGGWLPTDRATLQVGGRPNVYALGDATDLPLSKAGSTAHFEAPVVTERIVAAIEGRGVDHKHGDYLGKVMCFFEVGDGKGTLLQFDYNHPPRPPKPNQIWHLGKIVFNKTYWHTVPKGRV